MSCLNSSDNLRTLDQYKLKPIPHRPAEQTLCIRDKNSPSHAKSSRLVRYRLAVLKVFWLCHGHDAQIAKASGQWNQTSNPCSLEVKAAITNLVICLGSQWVYIISSRYHHNSFSHVSGTEIGVTYTSLVGQAKSIWIFSFVQFWLPRLFNSLPSGHFFSLYVTIYFYHFREEIPKGLYHNDNETLCFTGQVSGSIFVVF